MGRLRVLIFLVAIAMGIVGQQQTQARDRHRPRGEAGSFDYYVLSLSWSPEYCAGPAGQNDPHQCGGRRQYGFVVHGLWPQYERGYPQFCDGDPTVGRALVQRMLPIMPSEKLIRHEWKKHGTCSGHTAEQYFEKVEDAFALVTIPARYKNPPDAVSVEPRQLKEDFVTSNRHFTKESFAVLCDGRFLKEVRVCLDKDLRTRSCGAEVRDSCRAEKIILRPIR